MSIDEMIKQFQTRRETMTLRSREFSSPPAPVTELFIRDFGMYTREGNEEVTKLVRYIEDMMMRRVDETVIVETINVGLSLIAKKGHTEVYDDWVLDELEIIFEAIIDDLVASDVDPLLRLLDEPIDIDVPSEWELDRFRDSSSEVHELSVP